MLVRGEADGRGAAGRRWEDKTGGHGEHRGPQSFPGRVGAAHTQGLGLGPSPRPSSQREMWHRGHHGGGVTYTGARCHSSLHGAALLVSLCPLEGPVGSEAQ